MYVVILNKRTSYYVFELRKAIYDRSRLRNRFCKTPTEEKENLYKKQRNNCVSIRKKNIRNYSNEIANVWWPKAAIVKKKQINKQRKVVCVL